MSEFDNEYKSDSFEKGEAVEAFEDFELSQDELDASSETYEVFDEIDDYEEYDQNEEPEAADDPEEFVEDPKEFVEDPEEFVEDPEEAVVEPEEAVVEPEEAVVEPEEAVVEPEEVVEEPEEVVEEPKEVVEEPEEVVEEPEEIIEDPEEIIEEPEETVEEPVEIVEEPEEVVEVPEEADESDWAVEEAEEVDETVFFPGEPDDEDEEIDIMSTIIALENGAANQKEEMDILDSEETGSDDIEEIEDEEPVSDDTYEKSESTDENEDDDYLDYDNDSRSKKIVSGKAALITMLVTGIVTIGLIVAVVWMGITVNRDIGITVASYSDRFNACDTNSFSLGQVMGATIISMSDEDCTLSKKEINALKNGDTVTKFHNMMNIKADTRFGKIVTMDFSFTPVLNEQKEPGITSIVLLGNAMSGLIKNIDTSDKAFLVAYKALLENSVPVAEKGNKVFVYKNDDISIYTDLSDMKNADDYSGLKVHIENKEPKFIDTDKLDFSWLPFNLSSDKSKTDTTVSQSDK